MEAVRVEKLARTLHVTKGSFYWHFKNRKEILETLLRQEWEAERDVLSNLIGEERLGMALANLFSEVGRRARLSRVGETPSDAAIFAWAAVSKEVAARVNKEEKVRIRILKKVFRRDEAAEYVYMAYLGFTARRQRVPTTMRNFPILAKLSTALLLYEPHCDNSNTK